MKLRYRIFLFILISISATSLESEKNLKSYFIVWNVGQGQWATRVDSESCHHFDIGGEKTATRKIKLLCRRKRNFLYISHWDWDHMGFAATVQKSLPNACLTLSPDGKSSPRKMRLLGAFPKCNAESSLIQSLHRSQAGAKSNDLSHVLLVENRFLLPGDSTRRQEEIWSREAVVKKARWLLLGHHGSRTSTSEDLLRQMPNLKMAVASARFKRYGHPHSEVIIRLKRHHIPLLRTEDWGHLWFEIAS